MNKFRASEFLNADERCVRKGLKNAKKIQKIELRKLRNMLAHEYYCRRIRSDGHCSPQSNRAFAHKDSHTKGRFLERVIKGGSGGTEIIHSKKKRAR